MSGFDSEMAEQGCKHGSIQYDISRWTLSDIGSRNKFPKLAHYLNSDSKQTKTNQNRKYRQIEPLLGTMSHFGRKVCKILLILSDWGEPDIRVKF